MHGTERVLALTFTLGIWKAFPGCLSIFVNSVHKMPFLNKRMVVVDLTFYPIGLLFQSKAWG